MATVSRSARLRTLLGWPIGIAAVSWRYMWRTTPLHRCEEPGTRADLPDPAYGPSGQAARQQTLEMGAGPMLHRSYAVRITGTSMTPAALVNLVAARLNQVSPEMAVFRKTRGSASALCVGDEFLVRMPGPWDGPVRVVRRDPAAFRLATLDGHLEAGEIEFRAAPDGNTGPLRDRILGPGRGPARGPALQQAAAGQGDPAQHVVPRLHPHRRPGRRPSAGRHHHPHPLARLARAGK